MNAVKRENSCPGGTGCRDEMYTQSYRYQADNILKLIFGGLKRKYEAVSSLSEVQAMVIHVAATSNSGPRK